VTAPRSPEPAAEGGAGKARRDGAAFLHLEGVSKSFGGERILDGIELEAREGETLVLLGRSGSGKTTLLRSIAGFETPEAGRILVGGQDVTASAPARRRFGMVFQHYALFPHLSVAQNVAFGLTGWSGTERARRVEEMLALVELPGLGGRRIDQISGGQQQRVALARALAPGPRLLLLDEPLSNLDPALRERTRRQLGETLRRVGITSLWVTHEQQEAFEVGDRVALLEAGRLSQIGTPQELYSRPADPFVAAFVGQASWLAGRLSARGRLLRGDGELPWLLQPVDALPSGASVQVLLRPEQLTLLGPEQELGSSPPAVDARPGPDRPRGLPGTVSEVRFAGAETFYRVELETGERIVVSARYGRARPGDAVAVGLSADAPPLPVFPTAEATSEERETAR
jgi:ABC-type Fe3+/spermidine/putrescine transport system ATPase subunit